jgi:hypothetical protein
MAVTHHEVSHPNPKRAARNTALLQNVFRAMPYQAKLGFSSTGSLDIAKSASTSHDSPAIYCTLTSLYRRHREPQDIPYRLLHGSYFVKYLGQPLSRSLYLVTERPQFQRLVIGHVPVDRRTEAKVEPSSRAQNAYVTAAKRRVSVVLSTMGIIALCNEADERLPENRELTHEADRGNDSTAEPYRRYCLQNDCSMSLI